MYGIFYWNRVKNGSNSEFEHGLFWCKIEILLRMAFFSASLSQVVTMCIKEYVGSPRPNFYNMVITDHKKAVSYTNIYECTVS